MPPIVQVDAFTDRPFSGNPAAVCRLAAPADPIWMQAVAAELNLAATAFVWPRVGDEFELRWFAPAAELVLCGHATLATAHVLLEEGVAAAGGRLRFLTASGPLGAGSAEHHRIELDFPAEPSAAAPAPEALIRALGQPPTRVERSRLDYLVELESEAAVRGLRPDLAALRELDTRGLIVTARSDGDATIDFVSRFFAPKVGIDEDHVTGSAHCCLAPYWQRQLGRAALVGRQVSRRGGTVHVAVDGTRVRLGGQAVTVARGELSPQASRIPD